MNYLSPSQYYRKNKIHISDFTNQILVKCPKCDQVAIATNKALVCKFCSFNKALHSGWKDKSLDTKICFCCRICRRVLVKESYFKNPLVSIKCKNCGHQNIVRVEKDTPGISIVRKIHILVLLCGCRQLIRIKSYGLIIKNIYCSLKIMLLL
ncbi:MAG: hypothetical protein ACK4OM_02230 [Alphaproteobacteria bacterium]